MKPAAAGSLVVLFALAFLSGVFTGAPGNLIGGAASAASIDSAYNMERMLNEPHPLAHEYGTRWQPAPAQPRTSLPPRPAAQPGSMPMAPPPAPPIILPAPAMLPASPMAPVAVPADSSAITPNLTLDETGAPNAPVPTPATPPPPTAAAGEQPPPPPAPAPGRGRQTSADAGASTVRVGARSSRAKTEGKGWLSEIRVGALYHDQGPFSHNKEDGVDANLELLFTSPDFLKFIWSPRPHIGGDFNTSGDTSHVYLGLSWEWEFWRYMFGGFSLGGAVHDGKTTNAPLDRKELGCRVLFRESIELGFRFVERHSVSAFLDHISNAKLCSTNEGLENVGIRYGYKF